MKKSEKYNVDLLKISNYICSLAQIKKVIMFDFLFQQYSDYQTLIFF